MLRTRRSRARCGPALHGLNTSHAAAMRALYGAHIALAALGDYQTVPPTASGPAATSRGVEREQVVDNAVSRRAGRSDGRGRARAGTGCGGFGDRSRGTGPRSDRAPSGRQALAEREVLFRSILDASPDAMGLTDLDGHLRFMSSAVRMFGYEGDETPVVRSIIEFVARGPGSRQGRTSRVSQARLGRSSTGRLRADGGIVPVEVRASLTSDAAGRPAGVVFVVRDITDRRRIRRRSTSRRASPDRLSHLARRRLPRTACPTASIGHQRRLHSRARVHARRCGGRPRSSRRSGTTRRTVGDSGHPGGRRRCRQHGDDLPPQGRDCRRRADVRLA